MKKKTDAIILLMMEDRDYPKYLHYLRGDFFFGQAFNVQAFNPPSQEAGVDESVSPRQIWSR